MFPKSDWVTNRLCCRSAKMRLDIFKFREESPRICVAKEKKKLFKGHIYLQGHGLCKDVPREQNIPLGENTGHTSVRNANAESPGIPLLYLRCVMFSSIHPYERSRGPTFPIVTSLHRKAYKRELPTQERELDSCHKKPNPHRFWI